MKNRFLEKLCFMRSFLLILLEKNIEKLKHFLSFFL